MRPERRLVLALMAAAVVALVPRPVLAGDYVLIRNAANPIAQGTRGEVRDLFTGATKQWGGAVVQPVIGEAESGELAWLATSVFELTVPQLLTKIRQEVFRGEMKRPVVARTASECVAAVARYPGAIGVVDAETARSLPAGVAVLTLRSP